MFVPCALARFRCEAGDGASAHAVCLERIDFLLELAQQLPQLAQKDNLGLIAGNDLELANGAGESWIQVMAAMYAENKTSIKKQSRIAGAVVSTYFDLGTNVPRIFQAPNLSSNLPPGMPGANPMLFVTQVQLTNWYHSRQ